MTEDLDQLRRLARDVFAKELTPHQERFAEQHAVAFCAGLAHAGARPVCVIYSTFLQRGYDQLVHDVALPGSSGPKLGFLMYPQAETASMRLDCLDPDSFRYTITSKELTAA